MSDTQNGRVISFAVNEKQYRSCLIGFRRRDRPDSFAHPNALIMEPKKERTENEENGARVERNTYDDPDTKTHVEEIKIERTEEE